jgi:hypothetical protein
MPFNPFVISSQAAMTRFRNKPIIRILAFIAFSA